MNRSILIVLTLASVRPLVGCDLCAIYSATETQVGKGLYTGVAEQFTHFGTLQNDGTETPNRAGQYLDSSILQVFAGYNVSKQFGLQFNLPVIERWFRRPKGFAIDRGTEIGIGDASLTGRLVLYRHQTEDRMVLANLTGGLKFPTGSTSRIREEFSETVVPGAPPSGIHGHDLTLGSGSVDGIVGGNVYVRFGRLFFSAETQYAIRTEGDFGYQFANDLTWSGGPGVLLALNEDYTISLQADISGETKGRDTFRGEMADDTGITSVYAGPELRATWSESLNAELGFDWPVNMDNTALQIVPDYRVHAAVTWRF